MKEELVDKIEDKEKDVKDQFRHPRTEPGILQ